MNFMSKGENMEVFLAMPYSQLCNKKYEVKYKYKKFFIKLTDELKKINCEYFLAHEREKWGKAYSSDIESTIIDYETIKKVDLVCVIPGVPNSGGVHVEIGWASANKKTLKIFLKKGYPYSPMVTGIHSLTQTDYIYYNEDFSEELIESIIFEIKKFFKI